MSDFELKKEGQQRIKWPWDSLTEVGQTFTVNDPYNIRNGRQSVFQANKRYGDKKFSGKMVDGVYVVKRVE